MHSLLQAANILAEHGLVVLEVADEFCLYIGRPASLPGTEFPYGSEVRVAGFGNVAFLTNAPTAVIHQKRRPTRWIADISIPAAPGPVCFAETFGTIELAAKAILDCYFGDRIDFENDSLMGWYWG
jgi:hypothetical protein